MNTEVDIFKGAANLPTYTDDDMKAIDVGKANTLPRISIQGGVFSSVSGASMIPLGTEILCLILGSSGTYDSEKKISYDSKRYYKTAYTGDKGIAPDCASINGVTPDSTIESPMCTKCADCPMQIWGSKKGYKGGKAKQCADYRRLAICIAHKDESHAIYQLDVPTVSVANLVAYNTKLTDAYHVPLDSATVKLTIGVIDGIPQITFKEFKALTDKQYDDVRKWRKDELVATITTREITITDTDEEVVEVKTAADASPEKNETVVGSATEIKVDDSKELKAKIAQAIAGD